MGNYISLSSSEKASLATPTPITSAPIKIINESETDNVIVSSSSDEHEQHLSSSLLEKEIKNEEECKGQVETNETTGSDIVFRKQILKNKQNKKNNKQNKKNNNNNNNNNSNNNNNNNTNNKNNKKNKNKK